MCYVIVYPVLQVIGFCFVLHCKTFLSCGVVILQFKSQYKTRNKNDFLNYNVVNATHRRGCWTTQVLLSGFFEVCTLSQRKLRIPSYKPNYIAVIVELWKDSKTPFTTEYCRIAYCSTAVRHHSYTLSHGHYNNFIGVHGMALHCRVFPDDHISELNRR